MNDALTPETDAVHLKQGLTHAEYRRHAQRLERELVEARNEILGWKNKWNCAIDMAARAENALDEMTLRWERTNDALFDERALADRLARIVEYGIEDMDEEEPEFLTDAKKALAAWKEARK